MSEQTSGGNTQPAGQGVSDDQMAEQVAESTDSNREAEDVFERAGGEATDKPAKELDADDVQ